MTYRDEAPHDSSRQFGDAPPGKLSSSSLPRAARGGSRSFQEGPSRSAYGRYAARKTLRQWIDRDHHFGRFFVSPPLLGYSKDWNQLPITGPLEAGFDYHFGVPENHNDAYRAFIENRDIVGRKPGEPFRIVKGRDFPDGLAQPRVDDQVSETLVGKSLHFIEENRERPFFLDFTSVVPHTHITPAARFRGTSEAGLYGDYIQELDENVGRMLETLERLQLIGRTLARAHRYVWQ